QDLVRHVRQLPQRRAEGDGAVLAGRRRYDALRSDHHRPESVHAAVDDEHADLSREGRGSDLRVPVRRRERGSRRDVPPRAEDVVSEMTSLKFKMENAKCKMTTL